MGGGGGGGGGSRFPEKLWKTKWSPFQSLILSGRTFQREGATYLKTRWPCHFVLESIPGPGKVNEELTEKVEDEGPAVLRVDAAQVTRYEEGDDARQTEARVGARGQLGFLELWRPLGPQRLDGRVHHALCLAQNTANQQTRELISARNT